MSEAIALEAANPPGPAGWPVVGNLFDVLGGSHDFLLDLRRKHGTLASWTIGREVFWLLSEPELIEEVLLGQHKLMHKDAIYARITILGKGLVTSEDQLWRTQRKIASKPFAKKQVDGYAAQMRKIADDYLEKAVGERDVYEDMNRVTEQVVLEVLFGVQSDATTDQVGPCLATWMEQFQAEDSSLLRLIPPWFPTPGRRRARIAEQTLNEVVYRIVEEKRASGATGDDVLSRLLASADAEEGGMSNQQLRDEAVTMFVAGHETTALVLTWCLRQLALHPDWQAKVRAEVQEVLPDGPRTAEDARALPITTAVIKEAMRLHPPAWAIGRENTEDTVIAGRPVKKGTQLVVSQWVMHRDERWFPRPETFDPQRWLDGLEATLPRFVYLPFGGGPRVCIGNHFAMMEAIVILATLLKDRGVEPVGDMSLSLIPSVTLRPAHPVRLRWVD